MCEQAKTIKYRFRAAIPHKARSMPSRAGAGDGRRLCDWGGQEPQAAKIPPLQPYCASFMDAHLKNLDVLERICDFLLADNFIKPIYAADNMCIAFAAFGMVSQKITLC